MPRTTQATSCASASSTSTIKDDYVLAELVTAGAKPRRKRRGRRGEVSAAEQTRQLRELAEDAARQSASRPPIGISAITEEEEAQDKALRAELKGEAQPDAIIIAQGGISHTTPTGDGRRKRRRRRRGRGRGDDSAVAAVTPVEQSAPPAPAPTDGAPSDEGAEQHRRRRRRRRGRRGRGLGSAASAMPDRHIFEVSADGAAHPTGATAPPEPNRAIARRAAAPPPALEAPPPSLSAPAEDAKRAKPSRRRRTPRAEATSELQPSAEALALPPAESKTRRPRKKPTAVTETAAVETPAADRGVKAKPVRKSRATGAATSRKKKA